MPRKQGTPEFEAFVSALQERRPEVVDGAMFGMPVLKVNGKAVAGGYDDGMIFKLEGESHAHALSLSGSHLFDPMRNGRPMKQWVAIPTTHQPEWDALADAAIDAMIVATAG